MYHIQLSKIGEHKQSVTINAPVDTLIEAESVACRKCRDLLGNSIGYLCYIGQGNYLIRVGSFCNGMVKIKKVRRTSNRGGQSQ